MSFFKLSDLQISIKKAFQIAISGRTGPVLIDISKDVTIYAIWEPITYIITYESDLPGVTGDMSGDTTIAHYDEEITIATNSRTYSNFNIINIFFN